MSDVGGEIAENCGFEGKILCEVPQPCAPCDSGDTGDTPATEYTPPEGWRVLAVGELLQPGDQVVQLHDGKRFPTERVGQYVCETQRYIRPIEPQPEPVQVPEPQAADTPATGYTPPEGWRVLAVGEILQAGDIWVNHEGESRPTKRVGERVNDELYIRCDPIEPEPQPEPQPEHLQAIIAAQAETIARLNSEIHELNVEIGGLQRNQAAAVEAAGKQNTTLREQLDAAAAQLQKRHPDHVGRAISTDEWMDQFARDASVSRLQADRNDLAGKVITLREQLQQANDRLAFLETLQPIAAACHIAQTMVRDMLGHMRCLLALYHTTERRDFCKLLESILEVFDNAECDEDEDEDTTNTSEAKQG